MPLPPPDARTTLTIRATEYRRATTTMKSTRRSTGTLDTCAEDDLDHSVSSLSLSSKPERESCNCTVIANIEKRKKSVKFNQVEIIEFPYTLGDNPSVSFGPPISMAYSHQDRFSVDLIEYDDAKQTIHRRSMQEMRMDQMLRTHILQSSGHSLRDIMQATMEAQTARELRRQSVQSSAAHLMFRQARTTARRRIQSAQSSFSSLKQCQFAALHVTHRASKERRENAASADPCKNQATNESSISATEHHRDSITI